MFLHRKNLVLQIEAQMATRRLIDTKYFGDHCEPCEIEIYLRSEKKIEIKMTSKRHIMDRRNVSNKKNV